MARTVDTRLCSGIFTLKDGTVVSCPLRNAGKCRRDVLREKGQQPVLTTGKCQADSLQNMMPHKGEAPR